MEINEINTPTYKLLSFLRSVNKYEAKIKINTNKIERQDSTIEKAFCEILNVERKELYPTLSGYIVLIEHIKNQVKLYIPKSEKYISQLEIVEAAFINEGLGNDINVFKRHITETVLTTLDLCADRLSEESEDIIPDKIISVIEEQLSELIFLLEDSSLPESVKFVLLNKLDEVTDAVKKYKRWGINEFDKIYDSFLGGLYRSRNSVDVDANRPILGKLQNFLNSLLKTTRTSKEIIDTSKELGETVTELLEQTNII